MKQRDTSCSACWTVFQLQTIQGLVREMQAARRPWIPVNATVLLPLSYALRLVSEPKGEEPSLSLVFHLKNVGNSPAFNVRVVTGGTALKGYDDDHKRAWAGNAKHPA
jgi:hypothetical protein